ncbi:MAG: prepilin-type N-terminal cleavage/methylation domain-containing protein [Phycisphaerales bacterium]|nr:prepilin-type N-terminal cleavage/methylation domain-containing protein [Phycisphaerales bacterium]
MNRRAFTLLELLVTIVVLGVAAMLVIPAMGSTGVLRIQGAVRHIVADISFAQTDAMAFQERRAVYFFEHGSGGGQPVSGGIRMDNGYAVASVTGPSLTRAELPAAAMRLPETPSLPYARDLSDERFGGARILSVSFDNEQTSGDAEYAKKLFFDELGGPVRSASSSTGSNGGTIVVGSPGFNITYEIRVAPMTGRVDVSRRE